MLKHLRKPSLVSSEITEHIQASYNRQLSSLIFSTSVSQCHHLSFMQNLREFVWKQEFSSVKDLSEIQPTYVSKAPYHQYIPCSEVLQAVLLRKDKFDVTEYTETEEICCFFTAFSVRRKFWPFFLKLCLYFNYSVSE